MRYSKSELEALATQPPHKYEKEGLLLVKEKQDGFFRRSLNLVERWFRLSGNFLFYLKNGNHCSEPYGVLVLENFTVRPENESKDGFGFVIDFGNFGSYNLYAMNERERCSWIDAIKNSGFFKLRDECQRLKELVLIEKEKYQSYQTYEESIPKHGGYVNDISDHPLFILNLACDNLRCDGSGRSPNAMIQIHVRNSEKQDWVKYAATEIVEGSSNPVFLCSISFYESHRICLKKSEVLFSVYNIRERVSGAQTLLGRLQMSLSNLNSADRFRLSISDNPNAQVGFLSIFLYNLDKERGGSTESTPCRSNITQYITPTILHRRTLSLPPKIVCKHNFHVQSSVKNLFTDCYVQTYRFHTGLGGEIFVQETMAESRYSFLLPMQLLNVWISEEKELLQEMIGLGELREPWNTRQVDLIEKHLAFIKYYNKAKQNLEQYKGNFKPSSVKGDEKYEFVPVNLHLQRIWAQNESLKKSGFHDIFTCGAFTAFAQGYGESVTSNILDISDKQLKTEEPKSSFYVDDKIKVTAHCIQGIKALRREIVERLQMIVKLAKNRKTEQMQNFVKQIYQKCGELLYICEESLIMEAMELLEEKKLFSPTNNVNQFLSVDEMSAEDDVGTPNSPARSIVEILKSKRDEKPCDNTPDSGLGLEEMIGSFLDAPSSNYYRPYEEPEPWELTQLNIRASIISLKSKIGVLASISPSLSADRDSQEDLNVTDASTGSKTIALRINNNESDEIARVDWSDELRASAKKLRSAMDGLLKTCRLAHSIFRLQENSQQVQAEFLRKHRKDVCFSQALTTAITGIMTRLWCHPVEISFLFVLMKLGPLVCFHSLLTYLGQEAEMFNDLQGAIESLKNVEFILVSCEVDETNPPLPKIQGSRSKLRVLLPILPSIFSILGSQRKFFVTPVLFNVGINEQASLAYKLGSCEPEAKCNLENFAKVNEYHRRFKKLTIPLSTCSVRANSTSPGDCNIDHLLDQMHQELLSKRHKNVNILSLSSLITRKLFGIRCISCKSGKDRTSMAATLEQCQVLNDEYELAEHEFQTALDAMRSEGCRRENTLKNIGQRKYAFNAFQRKMLPKLFKPPVGTFGSVAT